jgi:hypothetical protein
MKRFYLIACFLLASSSFAFLKAAEPESTSFPGVQKAMKPEDYEAAGLSKLEPAERAKLDEFIRSYVSVSNEKASTAAVEQAVKDKKVTPEVIESRIVGPFTGYTGRTVFTLENGQKWAQSQRDSRYIPKIDSPPVVIVKAGMGYRMHIAGGGMIRVSRVN